MKAFTYKCDMYVLSIRLFCPCKQDSMPSVLPSVLPLCVLRPLPCHHIRQRSGGAIVCEKQKHYKELFSIISTLREGLQIISRNLPGAHSAESFGRELRRVAIVSAAR